MTLYSIQIKYFEWNSRSTGKKNRMQIGGEGVENMILNMVLHFFYKKYTKI
jgi:hypothetical protein